MAHTEIKILDQSELLKTNATISGRVCKTHRDIICGRRRELELSDSGHTIITGSTKQNAKLNKLMNDLYNVYRHDPHTDNGCSQLPFIDTLNEHEGSEFHIYSTRDGRVKGFFVSFIIEFQGGRVPVPTMTFVWVIPQFRRQGLFTQMHRDLVNRRGVVMVDNPNSVCKAALDNIGYSFEGVMAEYFQ